MSANNIDSQKPTPMLEVNNLKKYFPIIRGLGRKVVGTLRAVDGVSFSIPAHITLGLVGESGCGKSTVAKCIMRALEPTDGQVRLRSNDEMVDITHLKESELRSLRRSFQMIFQDPYRSINPRVMVRSVVGESLYAFKVPKQEIVQRIEQLLTLVGLTPDMASRYPYAFSGGQRQRIAIARAISMNPNLLVLDEPVSALDVSVQAQILNLLKDLQNQLGLAYLFISHDLSVIRYMSDTIAVMYLGRIMELGDSDTIFKRYQHPYTEMLMAALPDADPDSDWSVSKVVGEIDTLDVAGVITGCIFTKRCPYAQPQCHTTSPEYRNIADTADYPHYVACHYPLPVDKLPINPTKDDPGRFTDN
jgi:peptide/nickel transport system ATP-binding protein